MYKKTHPRISLEILRRCPIIMISIPRASLWCRIVLALSLPSSIPILSARTLSFGCTRLHTFFISSRKSMPSSALIPSKDMVAMAVEARLGILSSVVNVFRHVFWFSTKKRINSSCSSTTWASAYWSALADSRVGSATTITRRASVVAWPSIGWCTAVIEGVAATTPSQCCPPQKKKKKKKFLERVMNVQEGREEVACNRRGSFLLCNLWRRMSILTTFSDAQIFFFF